MSDAAAKDKLRRALVALKTLRARYEALERTQCEPIAIVGMACRFPGGAETPSAYWKLLADGRDASSEIPENRWPADAFYDPDPEKPGKMHTKRGSFLSQTIESFDADFFGISPREARMLSPEQRLLLEVSWEALENGGFAPGDLGGTRTGVFLGIGMSDYVYLCSAALTPEDIDPYSGVGQTASVAAGRLSHSLGLRGPTISVDTACSSSLVALDLAVRSLRASECRMALVAGASVMLSPYTHLYLSKLRALSPDGRCKTFDASADGFGRGEGCGVLVAKRLSDAVADGDDIIALIRGSSVNHDGKSAGLTVPSGAAQEAVIKQALANAGVSAEQVSYVEAHGTGTQLGDPIEARSIQNVFSGGHDQENPLHLGSCKANIGHLEAAAGIAGVIKVALALKHRQIPKLAHFKRLNRHIGFDQRVFKIPTELTDWEIPEQASSRVAGISAFSIAGTNAHVVLEEASTPAFEPAAVDRPAHVFAFSAREENLLDELSDRHAAHLTESEADFGDLCYSANAGRSHFRHRSAVVASSREEALARLKRGRALRGAAPVQHTSKVAFLFPARVSAEVAGALLDRQPSLRRDYDATVEVADTLGFADHPAARQVALQVALACQWQRWGAVPYALYGEGVGEIVAAHIGGMLSLEDALRTATGDAAPTSAPQRAVISATTGKSCTEFATSDWQLSARAEARTEQAFATLLQLGCDCLVHVGAVDGFNTPAGAIPERVTEVATLAKTDDCDSWETLLRSLAKLYVAGLDIEWQAFDSDYRRRKVELPNSPFARKRYWVDADALEEIVERRLATEQKIEDTTGIYQLTWSEIPAIEGATPAAPIAVIGSGPNATALAEALTGSGLSVVTTPSDDSAAEFATILYAGALDLASDLDATGAELQAKLIDCAREVATMPAQFPGKRIVVATVGAQAVADGAVDAPVQAALWGLTRTLGAEHADCSPLLIDLDPAAAPIDWTDSVLAALNSSDNENQVAFRGGKRFGLRLNADSRMRTTSVELDPDALYLVTGGAGEVGLQLASTLVKRGARHLALVGRSATCGEAATAEIRELEEDGATISYWAADIASADDVASLAEKVSAGGRPLKGIVHAAGVLDGGLLADQTSESLARELSPKVAGAWNLHRTFASGGDLDWLALVSSAASILPSPGIGVYATGNAFLDGLSSHRSDAVAINWGPWESLGMAAGKDDFTDRLADRGMLALEPRRAQNLFAVLVEERGQRAVMNISWSTYLDRLGSRVSPLFAEQRGTQPTAAAEEQLALPSGPRRPIAERLADAPAPLRAGLMMVYLQELGASVSGRSPDEVSVNDNLLEIGFDSLMAMDMLAVLRKDLPFAIDPRDFYERPSVAGIATLLTDRFNESVGELPATPARPTAIEAPVPAPTPAPAPAQSTEPSSDIVDLGARRREQIWRRERHLEANGLTLTVSEWGAPQNPKILLLHGLQDQSAAWDQVACELASRGFHVVAPDHRGHGTSDHVGASGEYHLVDFVKDAASLLAELDAPTTVVGHSMGAAIGGLLALSRPAQVRSLVVIEPPTVRQRSLIEGVAAYIDATPVTAHPPLTGLTDAVERLLRTAESMPRERAVELAQRTVTLAADGTATWSWDSRLRASAGLNLSDSFADALPLANAPMPVTVIVGERGECTDASFPGLVARTLSGGHNLHHDSPEAVADLIATSARATASAPATSPSPLKTSEQSKAT